ncbi:hypothetical protein GGF46_004401 [Coemansia sp. RSA 552]|nr:hypothetical protein GGF46_004401 [Coemansia sp. RSA 552]
MVNAAAAVSAVAQQPAASERHGGSALDRWRGRDVVFVDPLDASMPYWWPAMIVPTDEIDATMDCVQLGADEYLVKYFEDCAYSTVRGRDLRVFNTAQKPFTDFAAANPSFLKDKGIKGALSFLKTGHVSARFQWRLWQSGSEALHLPFTLSATAADPPPSVPDMPAPVAVATEEEQQPAAAPEPPASPNASPQSQPDSEPSEPSTHETKPATSSPSPQPSTPTTRTRRTRKATQKQSAAATTATNGTGRRGRPPLASRKQQQQQPKRQGAAANGRRKGRSRQQHVQEQQQPSPASSAIASAVTADDTPSPGLGGDPAPQVVSTIKELEETQEEFRVFRSLVRRAAKDLWQSMGNEWPPNMGTSTRFGKRRKVA